VCGVAQVCRVDMASGVKVRRVSCGEGWVCGMGFL
jgi:hypothetical protein